MSKRSGFTLIEVVIALMILTFLPLLTAQSVQRALKSKAKIQDSIDKTSTLRDALKIIERDINMAFNFRDPNIELFNLAQKSRQAAKKKKPATQPQNDPNNPQPNSAEPTVQDDPNDPNQAKYALKTEVIYTQFIGEPNSLAFTSLSNVRLTDSQLISSQAEIGYEIKPCKRRSTQEQSSKCLWRRVANYIHEDTTKAGEQTVLLENVVEFKLQYLGPGRDGEWVDTWITNARGDDQTKGKFPYAVEVTLTVNNTNSTSKDKPLSMTIVAAIRNPNNPTNKANPESANESATQSP